MSDGEGFLSRWSRRKAGAREAPDAAAAPREAEPSAEASEAAPSDAEVLAALGLPDPDSLEAGADFRAFMAAGVPSRLRSRALRRLWRLNPKLANLDGLVDHGEDFTDRSRVVPDLRTAYRVGRGIVDRVSAAAPEAERAAPAAVGDAPDATGDAAAAADGEPVAAAEPPQPAPAEAPPQPARPRRRMVFTGGGPRDSGQL